MQHKFKLAIAAAFILFSVAAKAQQLATPQYIGKKCPDCTVITEGLEKWKYTKDENSFTETIESPDVNAYAIINWKDLTVTTPDGTYKITEYSISAVKPQVSITYASQTLVLTYDTFSMYAGHKFKN